ncbi:unnamed protein product, partial [Ectocarpus fasciculatus]
MEAHAEQILDVFFRLASDADWRKWLRIAVQGAALAGDFSVFGRLLAACPQNSEFWTQEFLYRAAEGGNLDVFSSLRDVCPTTLEFWTHVPALHLLVSAAKGGNVDIFS